MRRVLMGVVVGFGYGLLVGAVMFLLLLADRDHSGSLMIDFTELLRFLTLLAIIICGSAGALVGLLVTLLRAPAISAGMIGLSIGLVVLVGVVIAIWIFANVAWSDVGGVIVLLLVLMIMFPIGLGATGMMASAVARKVDAISPDASNTRLERNSPARRL